MRHVQIVERYLGPRDLLQEVVIQEDAANADKITQSTSLDNTNTVVGEVHVQQGRDLPEREGLDLGEVIVTEVEMADAE